MSDMREHVRERYAEAARRAGAAGCGSGGCCDVGTSDAGVLYGEEAGEVPEGAALASLGCGNPVAVAELREGEVVLDLGSGGGIDVILSSRRVGPTGRAYGLDMTDEMLDLARRNAADAGITNVEFLKGYIEDVPLPDGSVDVIISNCVINLSADKSRVFDEMARVLRDGGRLGISDIVAGDELTPAQRAERGSWVGCIAGALSFGEYEADLRRAGFVDVRLTPTHEVADGIFSAIARATKPFTVVRERAGVAPSWVGRVRAVSQVPDRPEVLFVCVHNAGRSQMAAALLDHRSDGRVRVRSAGTAPAQEINPAVVAAMAEVGLDVTKAFPKRLTDEMAREADVVVLMGCGDACPVYPGKRYLDWDLPDPEGKPIEDVRPIRDEIDRRVRQLLEELVPAGTEPQTLT